ncbi:MAG: hypothetical protein ACRC5T_04285, partial [Cetobacterium sp.]
MTTSPSTITTALKPHVAEYDALASLYPNLPELLSSTIGQMYNDELAGILAGYANSASKVRGRSG